MTKEVFVWTKNSFVDVAAVIFSILFLYFLYSLFIIQLLFSMYIMVKKAKVFVYLKTNLTKFN